MTSVSLTELLEQDIMTGRLSLTSSTIIVSVVFDLKSIEDTYIIVTLIVIYQTLCFRCCYSKNKLTGHLTINNTISNYVTRQLVNGE